MRQRALSVDLNPDIEGACMAELGDMCSEDKEDVEKGAVSKETDCHQNFENCLLFWGRSRYVCGCVCVCMGVWVLSLIHISEPTRPW